MHPLQGEPRPEPTLPSDIAVCLGERLRACYAHLMNEPVPDDLVRLLEALDRKKSQDDGR
jgi:hypothetical protein